MTSKKCSSPPLICPSDLALFECLAGCAIEGITSAGKPVRLHRFDPDGTVVDKVYGDAIPAFHPPVDLSASVKTDIQEEELTAFGARNEGVEDNDIGSPDAILYIAIASLENAGVEIDEENRDEFDAYVNRKWRRYSVIGTHYPQGIGGLELTAEVFVIEKGVRDGA